MYFASRCQHCSSVSVDVAAQTFQFDLLPKNAPAVQQKDSQPIWLGLLSLCYDLLSFDIICFFCLSVILHMYNNV